jgi:DNA-binding HxlR family transcriptional regulator
MALLDLLGRRWALRIIWELREETLGFRALQARCDTMSPSVLSQRLHDLQEAGIVLQDGQGSYTLSPDGRELFKALAPLHDWAQRWAEHNEVELPPSI